MPQFSVFLTARLNGVTDLHPVDESESDGYEYSFKVRCNSCREVHPNWVTVNRHRVIPVPNSRDEASFVWKCSQCGRTHAAHFENPPTPYTISDPPTKQSIIRFDCRGLEFIAFRPARERWAARGSETTTTFEEIDLTATAADASGQRLTWEEIAEGSGSAGPPEELTDEIVWSGYDEKLSEEVSIESVKWEIGRDEEKKGKKK